MQLTSGLACMHAHGLTTQALLPLSPESVYIECPSSAGRAGRAALHGGGADDAHRGHVAVRVAPYTHLRRLGKGDKARRQHFAGLCCPPEGFQVPLSWGSEDPQKGDVWRAAALVAVASNRKSAGAMIVNTPVALATLAAGSSWVQFLGGGQESAAWPSLLKVCSPPSHTHREHAPVAARSHALIVAGCGSASCLQSDRNFVPHCCTGPGRRARCRRVRMPPSPGPPRHRRLPR